MRYFFLLFLLPLLASAQNVPINIHLKSGETISTQYAYLNSNGGFSQPYVRIDNKKGEKITIDRVTHVEGFDQYSKYKYFQPIKLQGRNIWGERTYNSDRINIFYTNIISGTWTASYKSKYFQYEKDGQPLKKLTYANLKIDLADNPESIESLKKGNALKITQILLYGLGATLIGVGIANDFSNDELSDPNDTSIKIPPAVIAGAITLYIPWFINGPKQNHFVNALKAYK
ncbi:MAG: hypothetical protein RIC35_01595 [Marinoscillum sp.]